MTLGTVGTAPVSGTVADVNAPTHECIKEESCVGKGAKKVPVDGHLNVPLVTPDLNPMLTTIGTTSPNPGIGFTCGPVIISTTGTPTLPPIVAPTICSPHDHPTGKDKPSNSIPLLKTLKNSTVNAYPDPTGRNKSRPITIGVVAAARTVPSVICGSS